MGRKKKEKQGMFDKIGEAVCLEDCPDCHAHPECFACMEGRCTALKVNPGMGCPFYKASKQAEAEIKRCFMLLKERGRLDLIEKYFKGLSALGAMDEELAEGESVIEELRAFEKADYLAQAEEDRKKDSLVQNVKRLKKEHRNG